MGCCQKNGSSCDSRQLGRSVKILLAGDWHSELHEEAVFGALRQLGHEVEKFPWHRYFKPDDAQSGNLSQLLLKAQNKYLLGPRVNRLNDDLVALASREQPDAVFIYRGSHIRPETLRALRKACPGSVLIGYNNDDPFSPRYPRWLWRHYLGSVPEYDLVLAYRHCNLDELRAMGARRGELLRSWFMPDRNHPVELSEDERAQYGCDVVFVGHYEEDGRLQYLEEVARRGWKLRIFGPGYEWDSVLSKSLMLAGQVPTRLVWGRDYNLALCGARVALCFFSKLNRDTYTRRCFEIPACGTVLMSELSDDLAGLYQADREAVFFSSPEEMGDKLDRLLGDSAARDSVAAAGLRQVWRGRHDVVSRMRDFIGWIEELKEAKNDGTALDH
jgi:spore maturation protein CgeB